MTTNQPTPVILSDEATITSLARQVNEIYGTDLTERLLEVVTSAEQRLEELQTASADNNALRRINATLFDRRQKVEELESENAALREQLAEAQREIETLNKLTDRHIKPEVHDALERLK